MNIIYNKLKPKRKYHKTPLCGHTDSYCDMEHCRQKYAIKEPKTKAKIDENLHHREKVIKRRREIELQKLDADNITFDIDEAKNSLKPYRFSYIGEFAKRKQQIKRYKKMFWKCLLILIALPILYVLIINLFGI